MYKVLFIFICFYSLQSHAFISELIEAKKKVEGAFASFNSFTDAVDELGELSGVETEYLAYEEELREFQRTLDEYERLGLDVKNFTELRAYDPSSLRGQINFFKNYIRRAKKILKRLNSLTKSPEAITAEEQIETNKTLRALLQDNQTRELRKLRKEIAKQKLLLERRKKEREFINEQYAYINRHSKKKGFGVFHPFRNEKEAEGQSKKRKKFLGIF